MQSVTTVLFFLTNLLVGPLSVYVIAEEKTKREIEIPYAMEYQVKIVPEKKLARVKLQILNAVSNNSDRTRSPVKEVAFQFDRAMHSNFEANGKLHSAGVNVRWLPPVGNAWLSFDVKLVHKRGRGSYDSFISKDWAIFRGDDLFPSAKVKTIKNARAKTSLTFDLPPAWKHVNTGWKRNGWKRNGWKKSNGTEGQEPHRFYIDNPERAFDRPTGWMIAGNIATRRDKLGNTNLAVSGPVRVSLAKQGLLLKRMEIISFLHFVWPEIQKVVPDQPEKFLIIGAGAPMWRGGLSASNSLFIHADRPLVSENGTSTLLHEIFHSLTRIRGKLNDDWIAEGLAEYYSIELLYRAGGMAEKRRENVYSKLKERAQKVQKLRVERSYGSITAKAAVLFRDLDEEIRLVSKGRFNLDDVLVELIPLREVGLRDLELAVEKLIERKAQTFKSLY